MKAVRFCVILKAIGTNIYRAAAVRKAINAFRRAKDVAVGAYSIVNLCTLNVICYFKEQFRSEIGEFLDIFTNSGYEQVVELKMAA